MSNTVTTNRSNDVTNNLILRTGSIVLELNVKGRTMINPVINNFWVKEYIVLVFRLNFSIIRMVKYLIGYFSHKNKIP